MLLPKDRIAYLLEAYTSKTATVHEEQELMGWLEEAHEDSDLKTYVQHLWNKYSPGTEINSVNWDKMFKRIVESEKVYSIAPKPKVRKMSWQKWSAAAAIVFIVVTGAYLLLTRSSINRPTAAIQDDKVKNDIIPPASNKATLTLANGKVIILDIAGKGPLAMQGATNASKVNDAELVYAANAITAVEYHTLSVPKGSKPMQLQLADGSVVLLNAASNITFPNIFTATERKVTVTGEAYFEIAKNSGKKFLVTANGVTTEVLGTHFNINAYENESSIRVTLLEGAVKVYKADQSTNLKPGQQARFTSEGNVKVINHINTEEVIAWKNGVFEFDETDIQTIMRQIERWYDVEIVFDGTVSQHFNGTISRHVNVSKVLTMLEKAGGVRFSIEGKKIVVRNN